MRIYKSFFRFEKCRKACKYRLYRLMRTYKEIVKNYILILSKIFGFSSQLPCKLFYTYQKKSFAKRINFTLLTPFRQCSIQYSKSPEMLKSRDFYYIAVFYSQLSRFVKPTNLVNCFWKNRLTVSTGPLRCLAIISSVCLFSVSGL